jgi:DNA-directed RNA polymerase specialized sigma24 family protein
MTEEGMRNYLESHFYASKKIKALEAERTQLRLNATGGAVRFEDNNTTSKTNGTERKLMSLADEEAELDRQIVELRVMQRSIRELIASLNDNDLESVLIYRYIAYHTEEETAEDLNYAPRTVQEKTKKAIKKLCAKMC